MTTDWHETPETQDLLGGPFHGTRVVMPHRRAMHYVLVNDEHGTRVAAYKRTSYCHDGRKSAKYVFDRSRSHTTLRNTG